MSDLFIPKDPINVSSRPLVKGMFRDIAPNALEKGAFWTLSNYIVTPSGLKRRPGLLYYAGGNGVASADTPLIDLAPLWKTDGSQIGVLLTSRYLYIVSGYAAPTAYHSTYAVGTCSSSGTTVTGAGTAWATAANQLYAGDYIVLDADASGDGPEEIEIDSINNDTELSLVSTPSGTYGAGTDYAIRRRFQISNETLLDWTVSDNKLFIVDHVRNPYSFDGTTFTQWETLANLPYIPGCCLFFNDRIWIGNIIESGSYYRQRIRWSSATDHTDFNSADFYDIPYSSGLLRRLVPLGPYIVAYFEDAIYIGRQSNLSNLPFQFDQRVDSRGIGLAGTRAVVSALNSHIFVGQDDVYELSANGLKPLKCPVKDEMILNCSTPEKIYLAQDPNNDRIVFGFPATGEAISRVWSYNYRTQAWSYDDITADALSNPLLDLGLTWDDLSALLAPNNNWNTGMASFGSWDAITAPSSGRRLFRLQDEYVYIYSSDADEDESGSFSGTIETGDIDLDMPDEDKTVTRLTLKLSERPAANITFVVTGSVDSANTWYSLGTIEIDNNATEGKIDFALTGSIFRFRLIQSESVSPYTVTEMTFRVVKRGLEYNLD